MSDHVPPSTIWTHIRDGEYIAPAEEQHLITCSKCMNVALTCLKSESLEAALKTLTDQDTPARSA